MVCWLPWPDRKTTVSRAEVGDTRVALRDRRILSTAVLMALVAAAIGLSACGRKGALEAPPYAAVETADKTGETPEEAKKPDKPFFLDPLLD